MHLSNSNNTLSSTELYAYLEQLKAEYQEEYKVDEEELDELIKDFDSDEPLNMRLEDIVDLKNFLEEVTTVPSNDIYLIHESHFQQYVKEDTYDNDGDNPLINYVDWEKMANEYQMDYTSADWSGVTYYYQD